MLNHCCAFSVRAPNLHYAFHADLQQNRNRSRAETPFRLGEICGQRIYIDCYISSSPLFVPLAPSNLKLGKLLMQGKNIPRFISSPAFPSPVALANIISLCQNVQDVKGHSRINSIAPSCRPLSSTCHQARNRQDPKGHSNIHHDALSLIVLCSTCKIFKSQSFFTIHKGSFKIS